MEGKKTEEGSRYRGRFLPQPKEQRFQFRSVHVAGSIRYATLRAAASARGMTQLGMTTFEDSEGEIEYNATWVLGHPAVYWCTPLTEAAAAYERAVEQRRGDDLPGAVESLQLSVEKCPRVLGRRCADAMLFLHEAHKKSTIVIVHETDTSVFRRVM